MSLFCGLLVDILCQQEPEVTSQLIVRMPALAHSVAHPSNLTLCQLIQKEVMVKAVQRFVVSLVTVSSLETLFALANSSCCLNVNGGSRFCFHCMLRTAEFLF